MLQQSKAFMVIVLSRDNDGTNQTTSSSHVFYDHDVSDADRNNTIGPKEEDNRFLSLLGQKFHSSIFNVNKTWDGIENMCSIADLQEIMVKDDAPLFALTHACVTGQKQVPTRSEWCALNSHMQRACMGAYIAYNHLEFAMRPPGNNVSTPPYIQLNTILCNTYGPLPHSLKAYHTRVGHHKRMGRTKDAAEVVLEAGVRQLISIEPGSVSRNTTDNCDFTNGANSMMTAVEGKAVFTPADLDNIGLFDHHVWSSHHPITYKDFDFAFPNSKALAFPKERDFDILDTVSASMLELSGQVLMNAGSSFLEEVKTCPSTLSAFTALALKWHGKDLRIPTLVGATVSGIPDAHSVSPKDGWEDRMPVNDKMQDSYFRLNNIHTLDVLVARVGAKEDVLELIHQMQLEAHVGHIDFRNMYS
jgi:hypothetical protein